MRVDAALNRDQILDAARALLAAKGDDVTMRAVARRAGVGIATLYRHFATREALIEAAVARQLGLCAELTDDALADPDAWRGLRTMVDRVFDPRSRHGDVPVERLPWATGEAGVRAMHNVRELARRAQEAGHLRADFEPNDLALLIRAGHSVAAASPDAAPRLVAYLLQSFSARTAPLPAAPPVPVLGDVFA